MCVNCIHAHVSSLLGEEVLSLGPSQEAGSVRGQCADVPRFRQYLSPADPSDVKP